MGAFRSGVSDMEDDERDSDDAIFKVDTVPPPPGDDDAYNAPTRVGPMSKDALEELIQQANESGLQAAQAERRATERAVDSGWDAPPVESAVGPIHRARSSPPEEDEELARVPSFADDDGDELADDATVLHDTSPDHIARAFASSHPPISAAVAPAIGSIAPPAPAHVSRATPSRARVALACLTLLIVGLAAWALLR